jgi:hypothetical protein
VSVQKHGCVVEKSTECANERQIEHTVANDLVRLQVEDDLNKEEIAAFLERSKLFKTNHLVEVRCLVLRQGATADQNAKLFGHCLEDSRYDLENAINQAQKAALNILIVVP